MKQLLLILTVVALVGGCGEKPLIREESAKAIETEVRNRTGFYGKPTGEPTKADLEKLTNLALGGFRLTSVKGLEKLTQLTLLNLQDNPGLTKAQIVELQKALPKCKISSNPTK